MNSEANKFTAAQIAAALGKTPQAVRQQLREVLPSGTKIVCGNEAAVFTLAQLPKNLRLQIEDEARRGNCRNAEAFLSMPRVKWEPTLPMDKISDEYIQAATKLREALRPALTGQYNSNLSRAEMESRGIEDYNRAFGNRVTTRYWRELFMRTVRRDNGAEDWNRLEIYLPDRLKQKETPASMVSEALADDFAELEQFIRACSNPHAPSKTERNGIWTLALEKFTSLTLTGISKKTAARRCRDFLFHRAPFLAASREALFMAFKRKLKRWQRGKPESLRDGRAKNGSRASYPSKDIRRVRHSAVLKNGTRIDAAWREEYPNLSDYTRQRHERSWKCPRPFYLQVNRTKVDALFARLQGKLALRKEIGGVTRDAEGIHSMARWAADDMTSNIEVALQNADGTVSLIQPQIIAVMDFASRKWVGWAISPDRAPTAKLVCAAVLDGFKRHGVPRQLWLENGFVFGKSLNVNGKADENGRTVVAGLAQYGCTIQHFGKMSPTSKGELEKSFDLFQRNMERHPGYTGRNQMLDATDFFKREQRVIRAGKAPASKFRYTYEEFPRVIHNLAEQYNAAPQNGLLRGLSPNEAFEILMDHSDPPIQFNNELHWMLANERYRVDVKAGGVTFRHYGRKIQVRGGELPQHIGEELFALVDRSDDSLVTFMTLDFSKTFTVEACQNPSAAESQIATGESVLGRELQKINTHSRAIGDDLKDLVSEFGNPRQELLDEIRGETIGDNKPIATARRMVVSPELAGSGDSLENQRAEIRADRKERQLQSSRAQKLMKDTGVFAPERGRKNIQPEDARFLSDFLQSAEDGGESSGKVDYQLKPYGSDKSKYVEYLLERLTSFRKSGQRSGQKFIQAVTTDVTRRIAESQMKCSLHDQSRFEEICVYLKEKIEATILGKRNAAKVIPSYHNFENHNQKAGTK